MAEILPNRSVETRRLPAFPLLWFARVCYGSVIQHHSFGLTKRHAFVRGCRWLLANAAARPVGPEETP